MRVVSKKKMAEQIRKLKQITRQPHKYGAKSANGFASKLESAVHDYLLKREMLGEITEIQRQQTVVLQDGASDVRIAWKVDFSFVVKATNELTYAEAKGFPDDVYKLKLKLFRKNPPAPLEIYGGRYDKIHLVERIEKWTATDGDV